MSHRHLRGHEKCLISRSLKKGCMRNLPIGQEHFWLFYFVKFLEKNVLIQETKQVHFSYPIGRLFNSFQQIFFWTCEVNIFVLIDFFFY